jgi:DNA-binding response OmpR family regulator
MTILMIDDDLEDISLFCEALKELNPNAVCIVAHTCENIQASMERIGEVDIIFLDAHMYPVEGKSCLAQVVKIVDHSKTKIVIYSGPLSPMEQLELEKIGVDYILIKAPDYNLLKSGISEILANHIALDSLDPLPL